MGSSLQNRGAHQRGKSHPENTKFVQRRSEYLGELEVDPVILRCLSGLLLNANKHPTTFFFLLMSIKYTQNHREDNAS